MSEVIPAGGSGPEERQVARPQLALAWLAALALVATLVLVLGIGFGIRGDDIANHALGVAIALLALVPFALDRGRAPQRRHILLTLVALVHLVFFALPVWTVYFPSGGRLEYSGVLTLTSKDVAAAQSAALVGLLLLLLGYATPLPRLLVRALPAPRRDWAPDATLAVGTLMIPLGLSVYLASVVGILPPQLGSGVLGAVSRAPFFGVALLTIAYLHFRSRTALFFVVGAIPPLMVFFFFTGMKERFFMALVMAVLGLLVTRRSIPAKWVALGFAAFVLFYPIAQAQRAFVRDMSVKESLGNPLMVVGEALRATTDARGSQYVLQGLLSTANRTNLISITGVVMHDTPLRVPFQGGWSIAYIPISFVPRVLWPGKPVFDIGQTVTDQYGSYGIQSSTGMPWVTELYWNFGWSGIVAGMFLVGMFIRLLHEVIFRQPMTVPLLLAGVIVCYDVPRNVENFLLAPMSGMFLDLGPLFLTHLLVRNLGRHPRPLPLEGSVSA